MIDIKELRQLAQAATPGPWMIDYVGVGFEVAAGESVIAQSQQVQGDMRHKARKANAAFIAAANPATVLELLDNLKEAEKERDELRNEIACVKEVEFPRKVQAVADAWKGKCERLEAQCDAAETEALEQARLNGMGAERELALMAKLEAAEKEAENLREGLKRMCPDEDKESKALQAQIEAIHSLLDGDESQIIRNAKDGYPEGREPKELTLIERVTALCKYASDWKRWFSEAESKIERMKQQEPVCITKKAHLAATENGADRYIFARDPIFSTRGENDVPLYLAPGAKGEEK